MIYVAFSDIDIIPDSELGFYLSLLPRERALEISKYKFIKDKKARLLASLLLRNAIFNTTGSDKPMHNLRKSIYGKPFIDGWNSFSISHSGNKVCIAYSIHSIGIDIENIRDIGYPINMSFFHKNERIFLKSSNDIGKAFFTIWTKKEALLKADGTGLINELSLIDCSKDKIVYKANSWHFYNHNLYENYVFNLCSSINSTSNSVQVFQYTRLTEFV